MLRPTGPMSALMQFSLKSRLTANGPPPAKLQPFSLWPIMAEENDNGLFEI